MKTPEEIKKGLECSISETCKGRACPYYDGDVARCIRETRSDALALICQLEAKVPRWIPVEERLPKKNLIVLVHMRPGIIETGVQNGLCWFGVANAYVTHWMPLPEPPEEG